MESQLEEVRDKIRKAEDEIVEVKQELAIAKQAGNKGGEEEDRFLRGRVEKLDSQLLSLNEKENILLRSQAPSKPCFQLVRNGLPVFTSCCTPQLACMWRQKTRSSWRLNC